MRRGKKGVIQEHAEIYIPIGGRASPVLLMRPNGNRIAPDSIHTDSLAFVFALDSWFPVDLSASTGSEMD